MSASAWCLLAVVIVVMAMCLFARRRRQLLLRRPVLHGIPLPQVDDPRWVTGGSDVTARLGPFLVAAGPSHCDSVSFDRERIGIWPWYARAVCRVLAEKHRKELSERAMDALTETP